MDHAQIADHLPSECHDAFFRTLRPRILLDDHPYQLAGILRHHFRQKRLCFRHQYLLRDRTHTGYKQAGNDHDLK